MFGQPWAWPLPGGAWADWPALPWPGLAAIMNVHVRAGRAGRAGQGQGGTRAGSVDTGPGPAVAGTRCHSNTRHVMARHARRSSSTWLPWHGVLAIHIGSAMADTPTAKPCHDITYMHSTHTGPPRISGGKQDRRLSRKRRLTVACHCCCVLCVCVCLISSIIPMAMSSQWTIPVVCCVSVRLTGRRPAANCRPGRSRNHNSRFDVAPAPKATNALPTPIIIPRRSKAPAAVHTIASYDCVMRTNVRAVDLRADAVQPLHRPISGRESS